MTTTRIAEGRCSGLSLQFSQRCAQRAPRKCGFKGSAETCAGSRHGGRVYHLRQRRGRRIRSVWIASTGLTWQRTPQPSHLLLPRLVAVEVAGGEIHRGSRRTNRLGRVPGAEVVFDGGQLPARMAESWWIGPPVTACSNDPSLSSASTLKSSGSRRRTSPCVSSAAGIPPAMPTTRSQRGARSSSRIAGHVERLAGALPEERPRDPGRAGGDLAPVMLPAWRLPRATAFRRPHAARQ